MYCSFPILVYCPIILLKMHKSPFYPNAFQKFGYQQHSHMVLAKVKAPFILIAQLS